MRRAQRFLAITAGRLLVWFCFASLIVVSFTTAHSIGEYYPVYSLRYQAGLSQQQADNALRFAAQQEGEPVFTPTFWTPYSSTLDSGLKKSEAQTLYLSGDSNLVYPVKYLSGGAPLAPGSCALSSALAAELWGSTDVAGLSLTLDGKTYTVTGVFDSLSKIVLGVPFTLPAETRWENVELAGSSTLESKEKALAFAEEAGLGSPSQLVSGPDMHALATVLSWLPLVLLLIAGLVFGLFQTTYKHPFLREACLFGLLLVFALLLPSLLSSLPVSIIPNKWSNFAHWSQLFKKQGEFFHDWFMLQPTIKDADVKFLLVKQVISFFCLLLLAPLLWLSVKPSSQKARSEIEEGAPQACNSDPEAGTIPPEDHTEIMALPLEESFHEP